MAPKNSGKKVMVNGPNRRMDNALKDKPVKMTTGGSVKASGNRSTDAAMRSNTKVGAMARKKAIKEMQTRKGK